MFTIRPFQPEDMFAVIRLASVVLTEHYSPTLFTFFYETSPETFLVAEEHHKIIGFAIGIKQPDGIGRIVMLGTEAKRRNKGIGSALLTHLLNLLCIQQVHNVELEVKEDNYTAIQFYQKHQFEITEKIPQFYQDGETGLIMRRKVFPHTEDD